MKKYTFRAKLSLRCAYGTARDVHLEDNAGGWKTGDREAGGRRLLVDVSARDRRMAA
jgi:hypothetical protein